MTTPSNSNQNAAGTQPATPTPNLEVPEVHNMYRETTIMIRDKFFPHYNLYQRVMLQEKVKCYEANSQAPDQYFRCIDGIDELMRLNSNTLLQKFGAVDVTDRSCQDSCKQSFSDHRDQYVECMKKCAKNMREGSVTVYNQFYDQVLGKYSDYKKIKK